MDKVFAALTAMGALMCAQVAQAQDSVYVGDCARARIIQQQSTIDRLITYARYEGVQRLYDGTAEKKECKADEIFVDTLTLRTRNTVEAVFDVKTTVMAFGKIPNCMDPRIITATRYGTVKLTTKLKQNSEICDLYIWSEWTELSTSDPNYKSTFETRVVKLDATGLVIAQPSEGANRYRSPIAYTGVP